jgi:hypothetical protein
MENNFVNALIPFIGVRGMAMDILFTFAGNRDPFNAEIVKEVCTDGPVLTLRMLSKRQICRRPSSENETPCLPQKCQRKIPTVAANVCKPPVRVLSL